MTSDTAKGTRTDVPFRPAGIGLAMTRACAARKGQWLCDKRISFNGYCAECAKARDERNALKVSA